MPYFIIVVFRSSHFSFLVFVHFWHQSYENTKRLCNLCLHFQGNMGKTGKKQKENHKTKVIKISTKNQKTKIWDERSIRE